jgi:hypothetical protein
MRTTLVAFMLAASSVASAHHVADDSGASHRTQSSAQSEPGANGKRPGPATKSEPAPTHAYCFQNAAGKLHCAVLPGGPH